jgi:hypothetical protein
MIMERLRAVIAGLDNQGIPEIPEQIDRAHFLTATDPIEKRLAEALQRFPSVELGFLILSFGLDGHTPRSAHVIADAWGMLLTKVLDIRTAAELRLRNRPETRSLIEALAGQEVAGLARHIEMATMMRDQRCQRAATDQWFYSRRPLRRLAMSTALEGGFSTLVALVRQGRATTLEVDHRHA